MREDNGSDGCLHDWEQKLLKIRLLEETTLAADAKACLREARRQVRRYWNQMMSEGGQQQQSGPEEEDITIVGDDVRIGNDIIPQRQPAQQSPLGPLLAGLLAAGLAAGGTYLLTKGDGGRGPDTDTQYELRIDSNDRP